MAQVKAVIFDAYGTLLDVHAAMARHADRLGPDWQRISQDWRVKQLEYSWIRTLLGEAHYRDFFALTREALDFVAARHGIADAALLDDVMQAYRVLDAYPEVVPMLRALRARGKKTAILSNGEPGMLADAVRAAGIDDLLDAVISVDSLRRYKVSPGVYALPGEEFGLETSEMAFLSSNPWDAFGAHQHGYAVHWVNRSRQPNEYGLRESVPELTDLSALPDMLV
jgi:2-haloacid dehalogenase